MYRILIADDDRMVTKLLQDSLEDEGFETYIATDGVETLNTVQERSPDLVILSLLLPKIDGFEVCRRIREWAQIPIIVLTALGGMKDKVKCLNLGADDYVTKPFGADELLARIKAVLRRSRVAGSVPTRSRFVSVDLEVDFNTRRVVVAGNEVRLTPTEYAILQELVANAGKVLTYNHLLCSVWGLEYVTERNYLHVFIRHLRTTIEHDPAKPRYIINVPGVGYRFSST